MISKKSLFLQIAAISILGASSISFAMDTKLEKEINSQKLHKFFNLSEEDLKEAGFQKKSEDGRFLFAISRDRSEKLLFKQDKDKKFEKVTSFKFNKDGSQIFFHAGEKAVLIDLKNDKKFDLEDALPAEDYDYFGFTNKDERAFLLTPNHGALLMFKTANGESINFINIWENEKHDLKKAIQSILKIFTTNREINTLLLFNRANIKRMEYDIQNIKDGFKKALNLGTTEENENINRM